MSNGGVDVERALVPTGHEASTYTCLRSLARRGVGAVIASEKPDVPATASRYCDDTATLPPPREDLDAYRDALLELAARPDVRTVIPIRPEDGFLLSKYRDEFASVAPVVAPPFETFQRAQDRLALAEAARAAGVPVPETRSFDEVDDWGPKLIVKSRYNLLTPDRVSAIPAGECDVVKTIRYLQPGREPDPDEVVETMRHVPIVQEYVPKAEEYVFAALYDHGEPLATFQHRQIRGLSYTGGGGVYRKSVSIPELDRVGRRLLSHLDWHGLACIEYMKHAETGEFVLTEINPRMWQSLPAAVRAGADFPYFYWLAATGRASEIEPGYEVGVGSHLVHGELAYLASVLFEDSPLVDRPSVARATWEVLVSCVVDPHFDYFRLDDPGPFVRGVLNKLSFGSGGSVERPEPGTDVRNPGVRH